MRVHLAAPPDGLGQGGRGDHRHPARFPGRRGLRTHQAVCPDAAISVHSGTGASCPHPHTGAFPAEGQQEKKLWLHFDEDVLI